MMNMARRGIHRGEALDRVGVDTVGTIGTIENFQGIVENSRNPDELDFMRPSGIFTPLAEYGGNRGASVDSMHWLVDSKKVGYWGVLRSVR